MIRNEENNRFSLVAVAVVMTADDIIPSQSRAAAASVGVATVLFDIYTILWRKTICA